MKADDFVYPVHAGTAWDKDENKPVGGITVRDHIAIEAMSGIFTGDIMAAIAKQFKLEGLPAPKNDQAFRVLANTCYQIADAMIEESNK